MARTPEDYAHELNALDSAHAQNEAGRDAFIALAHTALFAASVSFVGDIAPLDVAVWRPALILGWIASVAGLIALTVSFGVARKAIDARRKALNDDDPPHCNTLEFLNSFALWSFPVALLCLFSFVTANVVTADARQAKPAASALDVSKGTERRGVPTIESAEAHREGIFPTTEGTEPQRGAVGTVDGSGPGPARTGPAITSTTSAPKQKVGRVTDN